MVSHLTRIVGTVIIAMGSLGIAAVSAGATDDEGVIEAVPEAVPPTAPADASPFVPAAAGLAPVAVADSYVTAYETRLDVPSPGPLANDSDPEGDGLTFHIFTDPSHGTLVALEDGSFTYQPAPGFSGRDEFVYYTWDGSLASADVAVAITVGVPPGVLDLGFMPANPPPGGALTVTGSGCGPGESVLIRTAFTMLGTAASRNMVVTAEADGSFVATTSLHGAPTDLPVIAGGDEFAVVAYCGGVETTDPDRHQIVYGTVALVAGAPVAVPDTAATASGTPVVIDVLANDTGDDLRIIDFREGPHGGIAIATDGLSLTYSPDAGYVGADLIEYTVEDAAGRTARAEVEVTITAAVPGGVTPCGPGPCDPAPVVPVMPVAAGTPVVAVGPVSLGAGGAPDSAILPATGAPRPAGLMLLLGLMLLAAGCAVAGRRSFVG